jgi:hypothetical protein
MVWFRNPKPKNARPDSRVHRNELAGRNMAEQREVFVTLRLGFIQVCATKRPEKSFVAFGSHAHRVLR